MCLRDLEDGISTFQIEFQRMFSGEMDQNNAYLEIQSGSGGTEAQDWAEMLLRMYLKWSEKHSFNAEIIDVSSGDVAGIKGATVLIKGEFSYGWLRTETGVHRLVRKSPFDSGNRRHTSFASIFVSPEIDENIEIDLNPSDVRVDTYRASGAEGSTLTALILLLGLRTCQLIRSSSVRARDLSTRTRTMLISSYGRNFMSWNYSKDVWSNKKLKTRRLT